ncbi:MAG: bifunctional metallophosphatase/5'-nucleotidase [Bacteroidetes bacterium]|nr:bifunctional metallophosphatase/5'-nucleotidase [Bacteroidota bacterium]
MKRISQLFILLLIIFQISCSKKAGEPTTDPTVDQKASLVILYTNDEHGWMEADNTFGGAAGMFELWKTREGYNSADSFLVVSGGDMWTGPAISTWFQGESMIEVMNKMEYDVATIGNHEFDFTIEGLLKNKQLLEFHLIAANIRTKSTGEIPSFALPYVIENADGVKVAFIGLASRSTPYTTFPAFVADYEFTAYEDALNEYVPAAKLQGAEVIIVVGHIGEDEMTQLAPLAKSLGVILITGGHTHQKVSKSLDGVTLIQSGSGLKNYCKVVIEYDKSRKISKVLSNEIVNNPSVVRSVNEVQTIVDKWQLKTEEDLAMVIGYCSQKIYKSSPEMMNMVADSWLYAYPKADISMTNSGGIRQDIMPGDIKLETIVGLLPFTNTLIELELTGTQVIDCIGNLVIGGMTTVGGYRLADGSPIEANTIYSVLTTDYLYSLPYNNGPSKFAQYDSDPYNTSILYMQPTVDWIISKNSNAQNPINNYLDPIPRR